LFGFPFSLTDPVSPENFVKLWPVYSAAFAKAPSLPDGQKPTNALQLPEMQAIIACRQFMQEMGITPATAPSYGTRLSLVNTVLSQPELLSRFKLWVQPGSNDSNFAPTEKMLACIASVSLKKKSFMGLMIDFDDLEEKLNA
jgi:hypothetical protein